jgi:hypothetical protein
MFRVKNVHAEVGRWSKRVKFIIVECPLGQVFGVDNYIPQDDRKNTVLTSYFLFRLTR